MTPNCPFISNILKYVAKISSIQFSNTYKANTFARFLIVLFNKKFLKFISEEVNIS